MAPAPARLPAPELTYHQRLADPAHSCHGAQAPCPSPMSTLSVDTGLRRDAATIGVISVAHGVSHFGQLIVPPLFPWIGTAFGLSNTELGFMLTVYFVCSCVGQSLAGFVVDRHGAERVLLAGLGLMALSAAGLAASPSYGVMLVCMGVAGLGNCVFHPVDFSILNARIGAARLGQAYAVHAISGNVGWALAPVFVVGITTTSGSWRAALWAAATVCALTLFLVWLQRPALAVPQAAQEAANGAQDESDFAFLRLPAVWACFAFFTIFSVALGAVQTFAPAAAGKLHGVMAEQVALCLSIYMITAAAGMVLGGYLLRDPKRCLKVANLGFTVAAVVALAVGLGTWPAGAVPLLFGLMGFGAGIAGPSRDLLVKQAAPPGATGRVYGVVYSGLDVGMSLAPLIFGVLMDAGSFRTVWVGVALTFGLLIATAFNVGRRAAPRAAVAGT